MYKVLIVDDEPLILEGMKIIVDWAEHGLEIVGLASNGIEAIEILKRENIHILITDIKMPDMDGIELIKAVKQRDADVKFVILSGYADFYLVKEAVKLGIENYLLKPINEEELSITLHTTLQKIESEARKEKQQRNDVAILKENVLYRWMTNNIHYTELKQRAELLGIELMSEYYRASIINIFNPSNNEEFINTDAVKEICNKTLEEINCTVFSDLNGRIIILQAGDEKDLAGPVLYKLLSDCLRNINALLMLDVFITIGSIEKGFLAASYSYKNAYELMEYSLIIPVNNIVCYDTIKESSSDHKNEIKVGSGRLINPLIKRVINYINENYCEEISLKTISQNVNINTAYLGQLFKNETGEMFSDYVNKIRIEKAKLLLSDTKLSALEIAEKVGYINTNYFYNVFKKYTGVYPKDYKRRGIRPYPITNFILKPPES